MERLVEREATMFSVMASRKREGGAGYLFLSFYLASPLAHHQSNTGKLVPLKGVAHAINLAVDDV